MIEFAAADDPPLRDSRLPRSSEFQHIHPIRITGDYSSSDSPSGLNPQSDEPASPGAARAPAKVAPRFGFPLPFDPVRLLAGVFTRWPWIVVGMVVFGTLGSYVGIRLNQPTYAISVSLIKRRVPLTVRASETGQAFRPVDLNDATLLATLLASEPLDLALKRAENGVSPNNVRSQVQAAQLEGTDIFFITYHSPISPAEAVNFSMLWAEEINAYTRRLQQTEAREVRLILQNEVTALEKKSAATNLEILNFSKEKDYLGGEAQVSAALGKLSQIELQLETARTTAQSKIQQLKSFTEQIQRQSPTDLQLKISKEELANLRATYTDANPLVQAKLQSIEYIDSQIVLLEKQGKSEIDLFTGTPLGNQLYISILELRNELLEANSQIESLEKIQSTTTARLQEFPAIVSGYQALQTKREAILEGLSLMSNRLKEAEIFASGAPGYWQVFQAPDLREIVPSSLVKKPLIMGIGGGLFGAGIATLLTLLMTHRTSRRSILECCAATRAPLISSIPTATDDEVREAISHLWITYLAPRLSHPGPLLLWTSALKAADERRLWSVLAAVAWDDGGKSLRIVDLTPDSLWQDAERPAALDWQAHSPATDGAPANHPGTLLRAAALPAGAARELLSTVDQWIAVVAGDKESLRLAARLRPITDAYLPPCSGTIGWTEQPDGTIREAADILSTFLAKRFS